MTSNLDAIAWTRTLQLDDRSAGVSGSGKVLQTLQASRGVAAIMVLLFHATVQFSRPTYWGDYPFGNVFLAGGAGVLFFFALSGFIITQAHLDDIGLPDRLPRFVWNRFSRIYPLYWIITVLSLTGAVAVGKAVAAPDTHWALFTLDTLTLLPFGGENAVLGVAWTLFHELIFYAVFSILVFNKKAGLSALALWASLCIWGEWRPFHEPWLLVVSAPINLTFFMGAVAAIWSRSASPSKAVPVVTSGVVCFVAVWFFEMHGTALELTAGELGYGLPSAFIIGGLAVGERHKAWRVPTALAFLGSASYSIYLTHVLVLSAAAKILLRFSLLSHAGTFVFLSATAVGAGCFCYVAVEQPLLSWFRKRNKKRA